jgi:hypothetical protein
MPVIRAGSTEIVQTRDQQSKYDTEEGCHAQFDPIR